MADGGQDGPELKLPTTTARIIVSPEAIGTVDDVPARALDLLVCLDQPWEPYSDRIVAATAPAGLSTAAVTEEDSARVEMVSEDFGVAIGPEAGRADGE